MSKEALKQIKEQYARELHYSSWQFMCEAVNIVPRDVSVIAVRYAASQLVEAQERIKDLEQLFKDLHHYCNQQGIYSAPIQDMITKAFSPVNPQKKEDEKAS